jgi:hypothetical protein
VSHTSWRQARMYDVHACLSNLNCIERPISASPLSEPPSSILQVRVTLTCKCALSEPSARVAPVTSFRPYWMTHLPS